MDTAVDTHAGSGDDAHGGDARGEHSDARYWRIAAVLAGITAAEVGLSYAHIGKAFVPILLTLMAIKFLTVVSEFMHLRLDNKMFKYLFYGGLGLAVVVYVAALLTFRFFAS
jgi:cytochrome c oxidase subunit IV